MKKELLKKLKYEMPGMAAKGKGKGPMPMEDEEMEVEISMGPESADEEGMPEMPDMMAEGEGEEMEAESEAAGLDLSMASEEELLAELKKRKAKAPLA